MKKKYLLCITIPTYNREIYLQRLLESIVTQKGLTDEVSIVLNDGPSTDNTTTMVGEYTKKYKNISYFRNEKAVGMLPAILESIDMSNGQYTWLFGSDDFMQEDAIETVLQIIKKKAPTLILSNRLNVQDATESYEYREKEKISLYFNGFSDFSSYLGLSEPDKYQDKWNYLTFMSVFCFETQYYQNMLSFTIKSISDIDKLKKHYFNYIVILFAQLSAERLICVIEKPRLVFCQSDNTGWQPNHKINQDIKMLMGYLTNNYSLTSQCRKIFRRMYLESFIYGSIIHKITKIYIFKKIIHFLMKNTFAKNTYYRITGFISGSK